MYNIKKIDVLLSEIKWHHAFIRELYLISPSYYLLEEKITIAPYSLPDVSILIYTGDSSCRYIELILKETKQFYLPCFIDIMPSVKFNKDDVEIKFSENDIQKSIVKDIILKLLRDDEGGHNLRYGYKNPFQKSGMREETQ